MLENVNKTHLTFQQLDLKVEGKIIDFFHLIKLQNLGVLEPVPLEKNKIEDNHNNFLIIFLVLSFIILFVLGIWYIRRRLLINKGKTLINYEMQNL